MKALVSESLICALALGMTFVGSLNAQTPSADTARYGPYPTYYKEIIMAVAQHAIDRSGQRTH